MKVTVNDEQIREEWREYFQRIAEDVFQAENRPEEQRVLEIDYFDLSKTTYLADLFTEEPERVYKEGQHVLDHPDDVMDEDRVQLTLTIGNVPEGFSKPVSGVSHLNPGNLVQFTGMVRHQTKREKRTQLEALECLSCSHEQYAQHPFSLTGKKMLETTICPQCEKKTNFRTVEDRSRVESQQVVTITGIDNADGVQEDVRVLLRRDMTHNLRGGDEVTITGFTAMERKQKNANLFTPFVIATQAKLTEDRQMADKATQSDIQEWREAASKPSFLENVIETVFPYYYGHDTGRKAMVLSMFSSPRKGRNRGDVNILLVGDPGTGKSYLLKCMNNSAPRSVLTNAKTSSSVGLTYAAVRDDATGMWTIQSGALPLASGGICIIDEIDKASKDQMDSLLEALEDQTISVNKAGMNTELTAECSVIAAGNPQHGRWDRNVPIIEQVDITPPLLSRFDAILLFEDKNDDERLEAIADAVLQRHKNEDNGTPLDLALVRRMAWFCRENVEVTMDEEADAIIRSAFMDIRKSAGELGISARQMESMVRFAKAMARIHLRTEVSAEDAQWAVDFVTGWIKKIAGHHGIMDIDDITDPENASQRKYARVVMETLETLYGNQTPDEPGVHKDDLFQALAEKGYKDKSRAGSVIQMLRNDGRVMTPKHDHFKPV